MTASEKPHPANAPAEQPYHNLPDRLFYEVAGLTEAEWHASEERLAKML